MSAARNGGPAFPVSDPDSAHATAAAASMRIADPAERERAYILARAEAVIGMTLRDYFAAHAPAIHAEFVAPEGTSLAEAEALWRFEYASAMLKARAA